MAGRKTLRSIRLAREATNGTRVTPRYLWRGNGDWVVDEREVTKVEELVGISGGTDRTYIAKLAASVEIAETEATYKQLPALFYGMGMTPRTDYNTFGTRSSSAYLATGSIWRYGLNVPSTVFPTNYSYTVESGDNVESQVAVYAVTEEVSLTFEAGEAVKVSANMLAQYGTRTNAEGSFSEVGTLENVTVMLSSKTQAIDITDTNWTGVQWNARASGTTSTLLFVWGTAANSVWAVGNNGTILFWNGSTWAAQTSGTTDALYDVWGSDANNVWVVGVGGTILFWNGSTWAAQTSGTSNDLYGVWGVDANNVWAVGASGTILFWNGSTWASSPSGTTNGLQAVWGTATNNVWAVGNNGTIRLWNGSTWASSPSGTTNGLFGVWGTATNSVWVVGVGGTILFWNGSTWAAQTSGTTNTLIGIWGSSANSVWATGNSGTILFWNGSTWASSPSGTTNGLFGVWGPAANRVWAVGANGAIRFYNALPAFSNSLQPGNILKGELTVKALWAPKYWIDGGILYPGTMVLTGHEITGKLTFEHQNGGSVSASGTSGQIEKWRNQQAQVLHMLWVDTDSFGSEVAFGVQLPFKWDTLQEYDDIDGNNIVSGEFTSKYNETYGNRGVFVFHTGYEYSNIVGTI